ncbi:hypothetical protein TASIC1_0002069400 [Trichoderma asperellum]|uniref:C2H2-type domain-containing protein n=1 Tax=Trichoderma asperellum TaxID=101201 RepID=A0A6V8QM02_TRIAP|nr:hypothetical protein TASIC1_0002069400 [Trichoderma asperellum]
MENKKLDDPGVAAALALRPLVRSPTVGRLGPRRTSTIASSSSCSASSVTSSIDDEMPTSCVFIVWAAVKRNACQKMTPEERRECPLLRCRKRFPNHELMLQHLYSCDHLAGGEYWCYDCEKPEQLSDVKCRRCLGHPSKRRKIVTMAKSFFSSLGHKPKSQGLALAASMGIGPVASGGSGGEDEQEPPSYESVFTPTAPTPLPPQAELFSTEIHEIGSSEVLLPTIPECETETEAIPAPGMVPCLPPSTFPISPPGSHPVAVPLPSTMESDFINWRPSPPSPPTVAPQSLMKPMHGRLVDRPTLQVNTHLDQFRGQASRRSKVLAPSSSVRSTASTDSTDSTDSTASYNISPMSGWSGGWTKTSGLESTLTSPDDLISPQSLLPSGPFATTNTISTRPIPFSNSEFENMVANSCPSELPADIPMFDDIPTAMDPQKTQAHMSLDQSAFSFNADIPFQMPIGPPLPSTTNINLALTPQLPPPPPPRQTSEPALLHDVASSSLTTITQSLARSVQDALRMHIADSRNKLESINQNALMKRLCQMSLSSVAAAGLETMADILEGRQNASPLDLLCFIHIVFSLSLVIHEHDASKRAATLFRQALLYSSWFSEPDRTSFIEVVITLWEHCEVDNDEIIQLLQSSPPISDSKGKQPERSLHGLRSDPLVLLAAYFLDELEYETLHEHSYRGQPSALADQHYKDSLAAGANSPFAITTRFIIENIFSHQFSHFPGSELGMKQLIGQVNSGGVGTVRRLELELMQAGKTYLPSDVFFDEFIAIVRENTDQLYAQRPFSNSRSTYHRCGVQVMRSLISEPGRSSAVVPVRTGVESSGLSTETLDAIMGVNFDGFDFESMVNLNPDADGELPESASAVGAPLMGAAEWTAGPTTVESAAFAATPAAPLGLGTDTAMQLMEEDPLMPPNASAPSKPEPTATAPPTATASTAKVESDSCCEICGYRPKGDPRWFVGSMAKHMKTIHSENPQIFRCPYPGCTSQYSKRADNLRQHQIEKGHFVDGEGNQGRRPRKRKRPSEGGGGGD